MTHNFKNEDAYFQKRRRKTEKRKQRRKFLENDVNLAVASTVYNDIFYTENPNQELVGKSNPVSYIL